MIRFKTIKDITQITYPDPDTNETIVLLVHTGYIYCNEKQAKWLSRFPHLVEVPGEEVPEKSEMDLIEKEEIPIEKKKKHKFIDPI